MDLKQFAEKFNDREIGDEISASESAMLKQNGIVIVYGASDDLCEFDGVISDESRANNGEPIYLHSGGIFNREDDRVAEEWGTRGMERIGKLCATITPLWCQSDPKYKGASWAYQTELPHETFEIMEDGEVYCIGLLFYAKDLPIIAELAE